MEKYRENNYYGFIVAMISMIVTNRHDKELFQNKKNIVRMLSSNHLRNDVGVEIKVPAKFRNKINLVE